MVAILEMNIKNRVSAFADTHFLCYDGCIKNDEVFSMAEFCLTCFNKIIGRDYKKHEVYLEYDFCEECGQWKEDCVADLRKPLLFQLLSLAWDGLLRLATRLHKNSK